MMYDIQTRRLFAASSDTGGDIVFSVEGTSINPSLDLHVTMRCQRFSVDVDEGRSTVTAIHRLTLSEQRALAAALRDNLKTIDAKERADNKLARRADNKARRRR